MAGGPWYHHCGSSAKLKGVAFDRTSIVNMVQEVALLNTQGGFLSVDRPNPFMKRVAKTGDDSWEKFKIIGLERTDDCTFKVGIQTRDGDYLSATPSNVNSTGYHLLEYKGQLLEWETFTAGAFGSAQVACGNNPTQRATNPLGANAGTALVCSAIRIALPN